MESTDIKTQLAHNFPRYYDGLMASLEKPHNFSDEEVSLLKTYIGEVKVGLDLILPFLRPGQRVLEIGAGIGALGIFLRQNGVDVYGLEPSGSGFHMMDRFADHIRAATSETAKDKIMNRECESLNPDTDGMFSLIFSVHVLEHISDIDGAFSAMESVLEPGGQMVHLCPNYRFPYDPHFFIPILFWSPNLTKKIYKRRINGDPGLWNSLNFVTSRKIKQLTRKRSLTLRFMPGVMGAFFRRLQDDPIFSARHNGLAARLANKVANSIFIRIIDKAPATWTSPMAFVIEKPKS